MSEVIGLFGLRAEPTVRAKVCALEDAMRALPQIELPVKHHFAYRTYGRELRIPKGIALTGKIHKFSQLNVLMSGDVSVVTADGAKRVQPPFAMVAEAGAKRAFYAHEDSVWLVVHGTDETDVGKIEDQFIASTEAEYLAFRAAVQIGSVT